MFTGKLKKSFAKVGKTLFFGLLGLVLAHGAIALTSQKASASEAANGTCFKSSNICGLNGHNYSNYTYQGG